MTFLRWSSSIYLGELLEGNRREVERWLGREEGAFDWGHYFNFQVGIYRISKMK